MSAGRTTCAGVQPASLRAVSEGRDLRRSPRSRAGRRQQRRRLAGLLRFAVFLLLIFVAAWAGVRVAHAGDVGSVYSGRQYVIQAGDTLWSVAAREYGERGDLRQVVWQIRQANHLQSAGVQPGQHLTLPYLGQ